MGHVSRQTVEAELGANWERYLDNWKAFLRFPSIGSYPEHAGACRACAAWLANRLSRVGFTTECIDTEGQPVVFGERRGIPGSPTVLLYGHYDVQPVEPLNLWTTPPFEPAIRNDRIYARGAQDNKGQVSYVLEALDMLIRRDALSATVKVLIEGEEECGSVGISRALPEWSERLAADILMVADTGSVDSGAPTITMGLRGIAFLSFRLHGADHDLHSGMHGGLAPNAAAGMAALLASLHAPDGSVAVEGFYHGILEPSEQERETANRIPFDAAGYTRETGALPVSGETTFSPRERVGFRPTVEINGMHSGHTGAGSKTIIPAVAEAKISARLVPGQVPHVIPELIERHLVRHAPEGFRVEVMEASAAGPALRLRLDSPLVARAQRVLDGLSDQRTAFLWEGASVPIVSSLAAASGAEPLLVGFGAEDDRVHAPDESFSFEQFRQGYRYAALFLSEL